MTAATAAPPPPAPPIPLHKLCLILTLDLSDVPDAAALPGKDHCVAIKQAAEKAQLWDPSDVFARSLVIGLFGDLDLAAAHGVAFHPVAKTGEASIAADYIYSLGSASAPPRLAIRVVANLAKTDGVTALRVAMHALEILEGAAAPTDPTNPSGLTQLPHFKYGMWHALNFGRMISTTLAGMVWANMGCGGNPKGANAVANALGPHVPPDAIVPNSAVSLLAYYAASDRPAPAPTGTFRCYRSEDAAAKPYKAFLKVLGQWGAKMKLQGFFNLNNANHTPGCAGLAIPSEVKHIEDVLDVKKRYAGAFDRAGHPPDPSMFGVNNFYHVRRIFVNNYGRHALQSKAKPVSFKWDWVGMGPAVWGAGCLQVNGVFMGWMRGTPEGLDVVKGELAASVLGAGFVQQIQGIDKANLQSEGGAAATAPAAATK